MARINCRIFKSLFTCFVLCTVYCFLYKGITISFKSDPYKEYIPSMFVKGKYTLSKDNNAKCSPYFNDFNGTKGFDTFKINYKLLKIFYIIFLILLFISTFLFQIKYFAEGYIFKKDYDINKGKIFFRKCQLVYYPFRILTFIFFIVLFIIFLVSDIGKFKSFMKCRQIDTVKIEQSLKTIIDIYYIMYISLIVIGILLIFDIAEFLWGNKLIRNYEKNLSLANNLSIEVTIQH